MKILYLCGAILIAFLGLGSIPSYAATLQLTLVDQTPGCLTFFINGTRILSRIQNGQSVIVPASLTQGTTYNFGYVVNKCGTSTILWQHTKCATLIPNNSAGKIYVTTNTATTCPIIQ